MNILLLLVFVAFMFTGASTWQFRIENYNFKIENILNTEDFGINIFKSEYLNNDYFNLLSNTKSHHIDSNLNYILIGARNYLYNLTIPNLELINKHEWPVSDEDRIKCINDTFITNKDECDNYIKLFVKIDENNYQICSTNSYNPKCTKFTADKNKTRNETSVLGYFPVKNDISYMYNYINKKLYTVYSIDSLNSYYSSTINQNFFQISTHIDDRNWLNKADFINTFNYDDDYIYFVFNENQLYETSIDTVKSRRVSRISRVCLNDNGASFNYNNLNNIWTTFLKTKLNCIYRPKYTTAKSFFNNQPFYFDEITSMSDLYSTTTKAAYFYATFSTSEYDITASAVCVFHMNDILDSFNGDYSVKRGSSANLEIPTPRPSSCPSNLTYEHMLFTRKNVAMKNEIYSNAFIIESGLENKFVKIDADYHVKNAYGSLFDILFIATDNGLIMKFVIPIDRMTYKVENFEVNNFYKEKFNLFGENDKNVKSIENLRLFKDKSKPMEKSLILTLNSNRIISIGKPVIHNCDLKLNKTNCDNTINPYCFWIGRLNKCLFYDGDNSELIQLIADENKNDTEGENTNSTNNNNSKEMSSSSTSTLNIHQTNETNSFLISFLFILTIFVSFMFGTCITLKLLKQKIDFSHAFMETRKKHQTTLSTIRLRCNTIKGSIVKYVQSINLSIHVPENIRNMILSRFKKQTTTENVKNEHEACCSSSNTSENSDPRYVYVLNLGDYSGKTDNQAPNHINNNSNNNPYSNNCVNATPSIRTIITNSSNDDNDNFYIN